MKLINTTRAVVLCEQRNETQALIKKLESTIQSLNCMDESLIADAVLTINGTRGSISIRARDGKKEHEIIRAASTKMLSLYKAILKSIEDEIQRL